LQVKEDVKLELRRGAKLAAEVFKDKKRWAPLILRLEDAVARDGR
jgi:hypothetical protein